MLVASENIDLSTHGFEHIFVIKTCMFILIIEAYIKYGQNSNDSIYAVIVVIKSSEMMMIHIVICMPNICILCSKTWSFCSNQYVLLNGIQIQSFNHIVHKNNICRNTAI
ncbi:hypothetical protein H8356DRAFT_1422105 [Neocallimastix lanati (nom. inval.)]|nr:hypothetical protein H8356DRAFT_1422105 [Neocallimastix sp. JGI-2020a]